MNQSQGGTDTVIPAYRHGNGVGRWTAWHMPLLPRLHGALLMHTSICCSRVIHDGAGTVLHGTYQQRTTAIMSSSVGSRAKLTACQSLHACWVWEPCHLGHATSSGYCLPSPATSTCHVPSAPTKHIRHLSYLCTPSCTHLTCITTSCTSLTPAAAVPCPTACQGAGR